MSKVKTRSYSSPLRTEAAEETRTRILGAARELLSQKDIDRITIAEIAEKAGVAGSTIYAVFKSKEGILRVIMEQSLFGDAFQAARKIIADGTDPVRSIRLTADVACAIYESESQDLGMLRQMSGYSAALREVEAEFDKLRYDMQAERVERLFNAGKAQAGLSLEEAQRLLWMYTSRDIYRMLVAEGGWPPERYRNWLSETLVATLVAQ